MLHIIVAVAKNQAIGKDNQLLWHLRDDLKRFQKITTGHPIIMGRKTFESLPGMLPDRAHWVLTRDRDWAAAHPEVRCFASVAEVLQALQQDEDYFVIGGGEIYRAFFPYAEQLHITEVDSEPEADTYFPVIDETVWKKTLVEEGEINAKNPLAHRFVTYVRRA